MEYRIIRSGRKTLSAEIKRGELIVRAPQKTTEAEIEAFLKQHKRWIENNLKKQKEYENAEKLSQKEIEELAKHALLVIPERVKFYAEKTGVKYGRITIRNQRTKWGSCSAKGNLNFNCLLMLAPPEVLDAIVVHELCHIKHLNHSKAFYDEVLKAYPNYYECNKWLKENGGALMARMVKNNEDNG
ncbi:MAG: DUF45 domain-containing protein [Clostridia bacterium]|nr:DUF45 domain-containing protein [Clostridia bacterium]